jgi:hypothetical protein
VICLLLSAALFTSLLMAALDVDDAPEVQIAAVD